MNSQRSVTDLRTSISERLRERRVEINRAVVHRALTAAPPTGFEESGYLEELRGTIGLAVNYAIGAIEQGSDRVGPPPAAVPTQAESAARSRVGLEVVLRRYASGYSTLTDFLHQEVRALGADLHYLLLQRELTALFDRLVGEVSNAYRQSESRSMPSSNRTRRLESARRLLSGEILDGGDLGYELDSWHVGLVGRRLKDPAILRRIGTALDRRVLVIEVDEIITWAWLGGRRAFGPDELEQIACQEWPDATLIGSGFPGEGTAGWSLTHRQAAKAVGMAAKEGQQFTTYGEVALSAAILGDEDLVAYLEDAVLAPLSKQRGRGDALRDTLRVYLTSGNNVSSTASALGVSRQTVSSRLRAIETTLGQSINASRNQLEAALNIDQLLHD